MAEWPRATYAARVFTAEIEVPTLDGLAMPAYLARPDDGGPWPTAVVLGELFGLTDVQRDAAERVADIGYVVVAPHVLHRRASSAPLTEDDAGRRQGLELIAALSRLELLSDVRDALGTAGMQSDVAANIAPVAVGMSFGGHIAVLAAARLGLRACVAMYAGWLADTSIAASQPNPTGSLPIAGRLLILTGEADPLVPASDLEAIREWHPDAEIVTYPGIGHRFCSRDRPGYDVNAATDAWARTRAFLSSESDP